MSYQVLLSTWEKLAPDERNSYYIGESPFLDLITKRKLDLRLEYEMDLCRFTLRGYRQSVGEHEDYLLALFYAYIGVLAKEREVKAGKWKHYKGGEYEVIGTAKRSMALPSNNLTAYKVEEYPEHSLFLDGGYYCAETCTHLGTRVFYHGTTGRWARKVDDFLGLTDDGRLRFEYVGEETANAA